MLIRSKPSFLIALILLAIVSLVPIDSYAAISNAGLLDKVIARFEVTSSTWANTITDAASWLFWVLATISFVFTFGFMILKKADIGEFFGEFIKFTIFIGFFYWLLINAPTFSKSIINGLKSLAGRAIGDQNSLMPSGIVDIGFEIYNKVLSATSIWNPVDSVAAIVIALAILTVLALIAINMLMLLISGWILSYAGIFYLGFGGSRWTSDIAINYYKSILGIAMQLFSMVLIVGVGKTFIDDLYSNMSTGDVPFPELGVMLVASIAILVLSNKVPALLAGVITGAAVGGSGIGQFGAGAAVGAAAGVAAGAATVMGAMKSAAAMTGGAAKSVSAAFKTGSENAAQAKSMGNSNSSMTSKSGSTSSSTSSPFGEASGISEKNSPEISKQSSIGNNQSKQPGFFAKSTVAQTAGVLAKGAWGTFAQSANRAMDNTTGGRIAKKINEQWQNNNSQSSATFQKGNSISSSDEINDFVNKKT